MKSKNLSITNMYFNGHLIITPHPLFFTFPWVKHLNQYFYLYESIEYPFFDLSEGGEHICHFC